MHIKQEKESALAVAQEISDKYNIPVNEVEDILYKHGVHKAFFTRKYFLKLASKYERLRRITQESNNNVLNKLRAKYVELGSKHNSVLHLNHKLHTLRGELNSLISMQKDFKKIKDYDSAIDKDRAFSIKDK